MTSKAIIATLLRRGIVRKKGEEDYEFVSTIYDMSKKDRFTQLVRDAQVPFELRSARGGKYFATRISEAGVKALTDLIVTKSVPYSDIVEVVRNYYSTSGENKLSLSRLLSDGLVDGMCENHVSGDVIDMNKTNKTMM